MHYIQSLRSSASHQSLIGYILCQYHTLNIYPIIFTTASQKKFLWFEYIVTLHILISVNSIRCRSFFYRYTGCKVKYMMHLWTLIM